MTRTQLSSDEPWKRVEEDRLRAELIREPYLIAFRAPREEIAMRALEDAQEAALDSLELLRFAEGIARGGREAVRFERYLIRQGFYPLIPINDPLGVSP